MKRKNPTRAVRRMRKVLKAFQSAGAGWRYDQTMKALNSLAVHVGRYYLVLQTGQTMRWNGSLIDTRILVEVD